MLLEEVAVFGILGFLSALSIDIIVTEGKKPFLTLVLLLEGTFFGWVSGMMWVYFTGGLSVTVYALILPIAVSMFLTMLTIMYLPINFGKVKSVTPMANVLTVLLMVGIVGALVMTSMAPAHTSALNSEQYVGTQLHWNPGERTIDANAMSLFSATPTGAVAMDIKYTKSSVQSLRMMEDPENNSYMDFQISMSIDGGAWAEPYLKIAVFEDRDGNGQLSIGDVMWADSAYKMVTGYDDGLWRSNCVWENDNPVSCAFATEEMILPIFHAQTMTVWKNEANQAFMNTPEKYTPSHDMMSWERSGTEITLKEQPQTYGSIAPGEITTVRGRLFIQDAPAGKHFILVQAFDATTSDPFAESTDPIASKLIPFQVASLQGGLPPEWTIFIGLGLFAGVGIVVQTRKEWF